MKNHPEIIDTYIEAYNRKDVPAMLACLSDDIVFQNLSDDEVTAAAAGKSEFEALARFGVAAFAVRRQQITHAITAGDTTLMEIDYTATVAADLPNGWKAGQELSFSGASAFQIKADLIVRLVDQS